MHFQIRACRSPEDYPKVAELWNAVRPEPTTAEQMVEGDGKFPEGGIRQRLVAVDDNGEVIGYADTNRWPWQQEGRFYVEVVTAESVRHHGIGSALLAAVETFAREHGATNFHSIIEERLTDSIAFVKHRGYVLRRHLFKSALDLELFDESRFSGVLTRLSEKGLRLFTLADESGEAIERKLYELFKRVEFDMPGRTQEGYMEFDAWRKRSLPPQEMWNCYCIAADGERIVGVSSLTKFGAKGNLWVHFTGVDAEYRGYGVARGLKLLSTEGARRHGVRFIYTNNDSENAPMLAINRDMGFVPESGQYLLMKDLRPEADE